MPVDASIYSQLRPVDLFGSYQRGVEAKAQDDQRKIAEQDRLNQEAVNKAYQSGMVQNPDGTVSYDPTKVQGALVQLTGNPIAGKSMYDLNSNIQDRALQQRKYEDSLKQQVIENELARQRLDSEAKNRAEARAERRSLADQSRQERHMAKVDDQTQKLSKELAGTQEASNALDEIETNLGFRIDDASTDKGVLTVNGKQKDLPGVSIPGIGRTTFYSNDARNLKSSASKVFNTILKDRSGAAVTNSELERLKTEFGEGKYNTEAELVGALQRYKRAVNTEMINREAGFSPDVKRNYSERGGRVSQLQGRPTDPIQKKQSAPVLAGSEIEW